MRTGNLVILAIGFGLISLSATGAPDTAEQKCQALKSFSWPNLVIEETQLVEAGPANPPEDVPPGTMLPEHCLFRAMLSPRKGAEGQQLGIGMELSLPIDWNGRFAFQGGGGLDGVLHASYGQVFGTIPPAFARGFAVRLDRWRPSQQDHDGRAFRARPAGPARLCLQRLDQTTQVAKAVLSAYYGRKPDYSYFVGCSNGGRHGHDRRRALPDLFRRYRSRAILHFAWPGPMSIKSGTKSFLPAPRRRMLMAARSSARPCPSPI